MSDREKIRKEIERLIRYLGEQRDVNLEDLCDFIDSLPEEPVNEELEEAAKRYATEGDEISGTFVVKEEVDAFEAGANWMLNKIRKQNEEN